MAISAGALFLASAGGKLASAALSAVGAIAAGNARAEGLKTSAFEDIANISIVKANAAAKRRELQDEASTALNSARALFAAKGISAETQATITSSGERSVAKTSNNIDAAAELQSLSLFASALQKRGSAKKAKASGYLKAIGSVIGGGSDAAGSLGTGKALGAL